MNVLTQGVEIDIENDYRLDEFLDDGEQNLEEEANAMLRSWDEDDFNKEVKQDIEKRKNKETWQNVTYYDGDTDFDDIIKEMQPIDGREDDQIFIKLIESNPEGKQIQATHTILFDRVGYQEHEMEPWDSSIGYDGKPTKLSLLEGPIIPGLLYALLTMREGERANIIIRPGMAYGRLGVPGLVHEEATLFYHVKIHKVWDESMLNSLIDMERSDLTVVPIEQKMAFIEEHKNIANQYLRDDQPREALIRYKAAINCIKEVPHDQIRSNEQLSELFVTLLQNAAIAFNKLKMHKSATTAAKKALFMNPKNVKAYYQLVKARIALCDFPSATMWIGKATKLFPGTSVFDHLKLELDFQYREEARKREELMKKMSRAIQ